MFLTIFTHVCGQSRLLPQMYSNLLVQFCTDFEWILTIDPTDEDAMKLVAQWIVADDLNISIFTLKERGRHVGFNTALQHASGELFFCLEPEDFITGEFVEALQNYWKNTYHAANRLYNHASVQEGSQTTPVSKEEEDTAPPPAPAATAADVEQHIAVTPKTSYFPLFEAFKKSFHHPKEEDSSDLPFPSPSGKNVFEYLDALYAYQKERNYQKKYNVMPTRQTTFMQKTTAEEAAQAIEWTVLRTPKAQHFLDEQQADAPSEEAGNAPLPAAEEKPAPDPQPDPAAETDAKPEDEAAPLPEKITVHEISAFWSSSTFAGSTRSPVTELRDRSILTQLFSKHAPSEAEADPYDQREIAGIIGYARSVKGVRIGGELTDGTSTTFYESTLQEIPPSHLWKRFSRHFISVYELPVYRAVAYRTEVLRQYRFPVVPGEDFMLNDVLYYQLDTTYALIPFSRDLLVRPVMPQTYEGLPLLHQLMRNPSGAQIFYGTRIDLAQGVPSRYANMIQYLAYRFLHRSRHYSYKGPHRHQLWTAVLPGFCYALYLQHLKHQPEQ